MATRSLMALSYADYQTNCVLKKHAKNRPLGDIEARHSYVPAQPVLSCRTVDIDLPGTRTYRPRSTLDILDEQQRLIRNIYNNKNRVTASAPPRRRAEPAARSSSEHSIRRVNIEVKGRPLTSLPHSAYQNENKLPTSTQHSRPRTTGRLKHIQPATDCFMVGNVDDDLLKTSRNNRELNNQIHSYWKSENNNLNVGKFVRGQKRPDDVPPSLDAWLTFGGAAGDHSQGVIDAFASFKNSEEYYNIEGSVGSRVAHQLQRGDKIRIGINGVLQTQDLKVRRWSKENRTSCPGEEPQEVDGTKEDIVEKEVRQEEEAIEKEVRQEEEEVEKEVKQEEEEEIKDDTMEFPLHDSENGFQELTLDIDGLDDLLEDMTQTENLRNQTPPVAADAKRMEEKRVGEREDRVREEQTVVTIPLSWDDQCAKPDVKLIHSRLSPRDILRPVMSETHPVKFKKLINGENRPHLAQPGGDRFRVKQRSSHTPSDGRASSSKVKVVYIDPLTQEEEEKVNGMSVDEIVKFRLSEKSRENTVASIRRSLKDQHQENIAINDDGEGALPPRRRTNSKNSSRNSRPTSNYSVHSEKCGVSNPKLVTPPIHSSAKHPSADLSITTYSAQSQTPVSDIHRATKTPGKLSPTKPLHRSGAGQGSSIKAGPIPGEAQYIKITTQLKIANNGSPGQRADLPSMNFNPYHGSPRDPDYQTAVYELVQDMSSDRVAQVHDDKLSTSDREPSVAAASTEAVACGEVSSRSVKGQVENPDESREEDAKSPSELSESPAPTTVAISIPTADELSDKESPSHSPMRKGDDLTGKQRRERDIWDEQIDQITHLIGGAIVDS